MGVALQTEFDLTLPHGFVDAEGNLHREVTMRMATAYDEIAPLKDPRVQSNPGYLVVILLARVITRLGTIGHERADECAARRAARGGGLERGAVGRPATTTEALTARDPSRLFDAGADPSGSTTVRYVAVDCDETERSSR